MSGNKIHEDHCGDLTKLPLPPSLPSPPSPHTTTSVVILAQAILAQG